MKEPIYKDTVIIGAGLTGLTLAHKIKQKKKDFVVLEKSDRPGGVIQTRQRGDFVFETGPNTGIVKYGEVADLFDELSAFCTTEIPDDTVKKRFIWKKDQWQQLPSGLVGGIKTNLFSWYDKFRILGEPFRTPGKDPHEPLDEFVKRRMGRSFLNYAVDPFILGVYAGDPARITPKYALPKLYQLEQNYGSFIGGAIKKKFEPKDEMEKKATKNVFSIKGGLENLVRALYRSAGDDQFTFSAQHIKVYPLNGGFEVEYNINRQKHRIRARQVVSTIGSYELKDTFSFLDHSALTKISNLNYARVIHAAVGFRKWSGIPLEGFGGLVPYVEQRDILGALFMSAFLSGRAPAGGALLSVFVGGVRREDLVDQNDEKVKETIQKELMDMFQLKHFDPELFELNRYDYAIPQYGKESGISFDTINQIEQEYPGLILAGNIRDGIGMADRIKQASDIARTL